MHNFAFCPASMTFHFLTVQNCRGHLFSGIKEEPPRPPLGVNISGPIATAAQDETIINKRKSYAYPLFEEYENPIQGDAGFILSADIHTRLLSGRVWCDWMIGVKDAGLSPIYQHNC